MNQQNPSVTTSDRKRYDTAENRWAGIGPYYAMFPSSFADEVIRKYTQPGDTVIDPFAGRGTAIFSAAIQCRPAIGIEINPLGYVYSKTKLKPGSYKAVTQKLEELSDIAHIYRETACNLPRFFHLCFARGVREFLLAARTTLDWRRNKVDRTLMALILISLHGKRQQSLSNQMRQTTAMAPDYCIRWWTERNLSPPEIDPVVFILKRIKWRYVYGRPQTKDATVFLQDSTKKLPYLAREVQERKRPKAKLLITSPPYHNVTNYSYDQWLRLWLLGCSEHPSKNGNCYGGKFSNRDQYRELLNQVFTRVKPVLANDAIIYIRTYKRKTTFHNTLSVLKEIFPEKRITKRPCPLNSEHQKRPHNRGGVSKQSHSEIDIILEPC